MHSGGETSLQPSGSHSVKPGAQPRKSSQLDICASPQGKPLRTSDHQAEEEIEDDGLFIPMGRLSFSFLFLFFIYLLSEGKGGRKTGRETSMCE